jgi:MraZ protein
MIPNSPTKKRFLGQYPGIIDDKNRLSVPAEYRRVLPEHEKTLVLTPGGDGFLNAFPVELFNTVSENLDSSTLGFASDDSLAVDTALIGEAAERDIDAQGRIIIPPNLLDHLGKERSVLMMGRTNHFVIWSKPAYDKYRTELKLSSGEAWKKALAQTKKEP